LNFKWINTILFLLKGMDMVQYLKRFFTYGGRIGRKQYLMDMGMSLLMNFLIFSVFFGVAHLVFGLSYFDFTFKLRPVIAFV